MPQEIYVPFLAFNPLFLVASYQNFSTKTKINLNAHVSCVSLVFVLQDGGDLLCELWL